MNAQAGWVNLGVALPLYSQFARREVDSGAQLLLVGHELANYAHAGAVAQARDSGHVLRVHVQLDGREGVEVRSCNHASRRRSQNLSPDTAWPRVRQRVASLHTVGVGRLL